MEPGVTLHPDEIEAVARRVAELLRDGGSAEGQTPSPRLVDAATMARLLGVSRATVYAKAEELGAIRVGNGKRARLRFDPRRLVSAPSAKETAKEGQVGRRRRTPKRTTSDDGLLPIRGLPPGANSRRVGSQ